MNLKFVDKKISTCIKGIAAIIIMLSHFLNQYTTPDIIKYLVNGTLCVGIFFFYTGYGLSKQYEEKEDYLNGYIFKKIKSLYLPYCIGNVLYYLITIICYNNIFIIKDFILILCGLKISNSILWFMIHLFFCNILFYILKKRKLSNLYFIVLYVIYILASVLLDIPNWWYLSTSCFLVGIYFNHIQKNLDKKIKINNISIVTFILLFVFCYLIEQQIVIVPLIPRNYIITLLYLIMSPILIFCLNGINYKTNFVNKVNILLGNISLYIYLLHMPVKLIIEKYSTSYVNLKSIVITILISIMLYLLKRRIKWKK